MTRSKDVFIDDILSAVPDRDRDKESQLIETLSSLWTLFEDEYARVPEEDLDEKFTRFLLLISPGDKVLH